MSSCTGKCDSCNNCDSESETEHSCKEEKFDADGEVLVKFPHSCNTCSGNKCTCKEKISSYIR
jgi:hypothetical protein